ncbi:caspase family protein, partial [Streptomyces nigra]|uniref:caspase family protein n=1 Tax=Streptomyces nigra TaxID=1827580 RepID=UPI003804F1C5
MTSPNTSRGEQREPRRFLIAMAVAHYAKCSQWDRPELVGAREQVIETFTQQLGYRHQTALGLNVTRSQLMEQLRAFCRSSDRREDDLLAVYFSGHGQVLDGGGEHVLYLADTDPVDVSFTALPTTDLAKAMLRETPLRRLLLVLDTCYSGHGGNELAAAALERINTQWHNATGSGLVVISSAQPHQQAQAGLFPRLLTEAIDNRATAGHGPQTLSVSAVVQQMNDHPDKPAWQRINLAQIGLTGEPPAFFANPRHNVLLNEVDLALQQADEFDEHARRRDTELTHRMLVRAMGYGSNAKPGWWFSGRHAALADLATWLNASTTGDTRTDLDSSPPLSSDDCRVVTGDPGSGKTAVLGLIAALTHPERRATVPVHALGLNAAHLPDETSVDVTIYAQKLSNAQVLDGLAAAAGVRVNTVGALLEALPDLGSGRPFTALIDALDEADTPDTLCTRILRPLIEHSRGRIRLLLGTRPYLLDRLGLKAKNATHQQQIINLDNPRYADHKALTAYAARNLLEAHPDSPYRHDLSQVRPVARAVAQAAGNSFLVARITAGTLAAAPRVVPNPRNHAWRASLPCHAGDAMRKDLHRRLGPDAQRAADLLRPLAYAEGQGLPWEDIWAPLATTISGRTYTDDDLLWLCRNAGSYVVEATEAERSAYRLYHQALAEHLRADPDAVAVHDAFTTVLMGCVPYAADGTRVWQRAHPYTLRHLATHAAASNRLDSLISDADYLVHADPEALLTALHHVRTDEGRVVRTVYRASADRHRRLNPDGRRQLLALDAARYQANSLLEAATRTLTWKPRWATGFQTNYALEATLTGHIGGVSRVTCSEVRGRPVAVSAGDDGTVRVWDLIDNTEQAVLEGHSGDVFDVACTELDGHAVAVSAGLDRTVRVWDLNVNRERAILTGRTVTNIVCTQVEGHAVAVMAEFDGTVLVWDLNTTGEPTVLTNSGSHMANLTCLQVDGRPAVLVGPKGEDGVTGIWDLGTGRELPLPEGSLDQEALLALTSMQGHIAIAAGLDTVHVWDLEAGASHRFITTHSSPINDVAYSEVAGDPVAITASGDGSVRVWDLATGSEQALLAGHMGPVFSVACTEVQDRPIAVTAGSGDDTVRVWDLTTAVRHPVSNDYMDEVCTVDCTQMDDRLFVVTGNRAFGYGTMRVWDLTMPAQQPGLTVQTRRIFSLACTQVHGRAVAVASGQAEVLVLDLITGDEQARFAGHEKDVWAVACGELAGQPIAVSGDDSGEVRVWDLVTGAE